MTNKEKYAKEILDIACAGNRIAINKHNNYLCACEGFDCNDCAFYYDDYTNDCDAKITKWANTEYKEKEIDWNKVPVDTKIMVKQQNGTVLLRHFAVYKNETIYYWENGRTSYSVQECYRFAFIPVLNVETVEIAEGVDCSEWYKD